MDKNRLGMNIDLICIGMGLGMLMAVAIIFLFGCKSIPSYDCIVYQTIDGDTLNTFEQTGEFDNNPITYGWLRDSTGSYVMREDTTTGALYYIDCINLRDCKKVNN